MTVVLTNERLGDRAAPTDGTAGDQLTEAASQLSALVLASVRYRHTLAAELGVGENELTALGHLRPVGQLTPREIAELLGLTSGSITGLVDRLEKSGFITRAPHPTDRRSLLVVMTPAGRHAIDWVFEQFSATLRSSVEGSEIDFAALSGVLGNAAVAVRQQAVAGYEAIARVSRRTRS